MKKHRFRFTRESRERLEQFGEIKASEPSKQTETSKSVTPWWKKSISEKHPAQEKHQTKEQDAPLPPQEEAEEQQDAAPVFCVASRTHVGLVRTSNQDAVIWDDHLCGIADGMGGHKGGETASAQARDGLIELLKGKQPDPNELHQAMKSVNRRIFLQAAEDENLAGMGTTVTALWFDKACVYIAHVGDSRCYRLRGGELTQVTDDHSVVAELQRAGVLTPERAAIHPMRNVITRAVGTQNTVCVDMLAEKRKYGDKWLVCSDGLHGMVSEEVIQTVLITYPPEEAAEQLLQAALAGGGQDNVSLIIIEDREVAR